MILEELQALTKNLETRIKKEVGEEVNIRPQHPSLLTHGDYSFNIAFSLSKRINKPLKEVANKIIDLFPKSSFIKKIEYLNGFINIWISEKALIKEAERIQANKEEYPQDKKTILLEFGQPNTHKIPHIGHLFSYIYGESLARLNEKMKNKVIRLNYQGDIGLHVAKCLYAIIQGYIKIKDEFSLEKKVNLLQEAYQKGSKLYEESEKDKEQIDILNKKIYQRDSSIFDLWLKTREWSIEYYTNFEGKLGIKYTKYYYESQMVELAKKLINNNLGKVFKKSQGAIIFEGERYKLHTRVFINRYGIPTYEAKDIALMYSKINDFKFDLSVVTTAKEQNDYWKVIIKASELIFPHIKRKIKHIGFGMINLPEGKMSSRKGKIITAFSLLQTVTEEIKKSFNLQPKKAEKIALAAIKYSFLNSEVTKNKIFNIKKSISKEGQSGVYLLYTYARCRSVIKKANLPPTSQLKSQPNLHLTDEELTLLRLIYRFPEVIKLSHSKFSPHYLSTFLFELAQAYNLFYQKIPILKAKEGKELRLLLTKDVAKILQEGLYLLGIETVESM